MKLTTMTQPLAIVRRPADAEIPEWASAGAFVSTTRTAHELSIVCEAARVPADEQQYGPCAALEVAGPLDFSLVGIIASLTAPLAQAGLTVFVLSTYDTDYLLVRQQDFRAVQRVLQAHGHTVTEV